MRSSTFEVTFSAKHSSRSFMLSVPLNLVSTLLALSTSLRLENVQVEIEIEPACTTRLMLLQTQAKHSKNLIRL